MSSISEQVGKRIRAFRLAEGLSQEKLAEMSGCHPTYIGQLERGEKNATLETVEKISAALDISVSTLFEKMETPNQPKSIPLLCYEFLSSKSKEEQESLYGILMGIDRYKSVK